MTPRWYYDPPYFERIAGLIYGGEARCSPARVPDALRRFVDGPSLVAYLGQLYAITGWTSVPWLFKISQPTLVLAGDDDPIVPLINGRLPAALIAQAPLHVVPGGGHLFILERADEAATIVAEFLR